MTPERLEELIAKFEQCSDRLMSWPDTTAALRELRELRSRYAGVEAGTHVVVPKERFEELAARERRLKAMMPLFTEARDALPAITVTAAKLRGLDLTLADRMDAVGIMERWEATDRAMLAASKGPSDPETLV